MIASPSKTRIQTPVYVFGNAPKKYVKDLDLIIKEHIMKSRKRNTCQQLIRLFISALATTTFCYAFAAPVNVHAENEARALPALTEFVETVKNGDASALRGVYVTQVMALPVVQQPVGDSRFVSEKNSTATQFNMAARAGNVGLLAHNFLAGQLFFNVRQSDRIILVYGNGRMETFVVESILKYQTLPRGIYKDLSAQSLLDTGEMFHKVYGKDYHVTLQTCIEKDGDPNWGRLFIIAQPVKENDNNVMSAGGIKTFAPQLASRPFVLFRNHTPE
jgi:hypothetical protein